MITDTDITKLKKVFATKDELTELRADMRQGFREVGERFEQADEKVDTIAAAVGRIENALDGIVHFLGYRSMVRRVGFEPT